MIWIDDASVRPSRGVLASLYRGFCLELWGVGLSLRLCLPYTGHLKQSIIHLVADIVRR
jgi:hypothetical protein